MLGFWLLALGLFNFVFLSIENQGPGKNNVFLLLFEILKIALKDSTPFRFLTRLKIYCTSYKIEYH